MVGDFKGVVKLRLWQTELIPSPFYSRESCVLYSCFFNI